MLQRIVIPNVVAVLDSRRTLQEGAKDILRVYLRKSTYTVTILCIISLRRRHTACWQNPNT